MVKQPVFQIRAATLADVELLAQWAEAMAFETEEKQLKAELIRSGIEAGVTNPEKARYLIAEHEGSPVGTLMLTTEWSDWRNAWWWWIQSVYVPISARRLGVFRALYAHVEGEARGTEGVCGLRLYVENENSRAQATYAALGMNDAHYRVFEAEFPRGAS